MPKSTGFQKGYQDASKFNWSGLSLETLFYALDAYKERAILEGSDKYIGMAQRVAEEIDGRPAAA